MRVGLGFEVPLERQLVFVIDFHDCDPCLGFFKAGWIGGVQELRAVQGKRAVLGLQIFDYVLVGQTKLVYGRQRLLEA